MHDMEIERKFLVKTLPSDLSACKVRLIEQGYLCTDPVVRVRRDNDDYFLTYKGSGMMARKEYNLPLAEDGYLHLIAKADGNIIKKRRYLVPVGQYMAELDVFEGKFEGLVIVEVEFESIEAAESFVPPEWFGEDVTYDRHYHNSYLSLME